MILGSRGQKRTDIVGFEHVFKAKKVMIWDVSRRFAKSALVVAKTHFFVKCMFLGGIPHFLGKSAPFWWNPLPFAPRRENVASIQLFGLLWSPFSAKSLFLADFCVFGAKIWFGRNF